MLHEESGKLRTDPFRGEASIKRINHATITITRHTLQFHSHTSQEQDHPFAPPICLLQTRFLARRHTMIVPHRHTANPITLASLIAQSRFTFAQPLASTRLHHSATAGSTASSAPGHILIRTIDVSTLHIAGRASLPQAAPRTQSLSTALLWRSLVPVIYWAFTSLRALALPRTPCPFASLPDGILDSDGALPMAPGLAMPEGCFSIAGASFLTAASASV